jgi:mRNA (guanine-N7-)-methyltransferase
VLINVLDLGCGKGGDLLKWKKANVSSVTFVDIAENSLNDCQSRFNDNRYPPARYEAEFIHLDATRDKLKLKLKNPNKVFDLVSSQFVIHYSFETFEQANRFFENVSQNLRVGGYFIGTTTNANEIVKRLRDSSDNSFGNDIFKIDFFDQDKHNLDIFGVRFNFQLDDVVECPEYLANFKVLEKIALRHDLKLVFKMNFSDFFTQFADRSEYASLLTIMSALQPFNLYEYEQKNEIKEFDCIQKKLVNNPDLIKDLQRNQTFASLSKSEWDAVTLYLAFAFIKIEKE